MIVYLTKALPFGVVRAQRIELIDCQWQSHNNQKVTEHKRGRERPLPSALRAATFPSGEGLMIAHINDHFTAYSFTPTAQILRIWP